MQTVSLLPTPRLGLNGTSLTRLRLSGNVPHIRSNQGIIRQVFCPVYGHHTSRNLHFINSMPKPCNLCGYASRFQELRAVRRHASFLTKDFGSDEEDGGVLSDVDYDFDEDGNLISDPLSLNRVKLYPSSDDPVLERLAQAASVQDVFGIVKETGKNLTPEQASQAIVSLWDLQKVYGRYGIDFPNNRNFLLVDFLRTIMEHPTFRQLLCHIESLSGSLDCDAVSCMLLYLHRIGIPDTSPVMKNLILASLEKLEEFNLSALSRLSVYLKSQGLGAYYLYSKIITILAARLGTISKPEDLKLATICLYSAGGLVSEAIFRRYDILLHEFVEKGLLEDVQPKVIIKFIKFLYHRNRSKSPSSLQRKVLLSLMDKTDLFSDMDIAIVNHYLMRNIEPRELFHKIQERAKYLIELNKNTIKRARLMLCVAPYSSFTMRSHIEEFVVELLDEENFYELIPIAFKCLRSIRTSNFKLCNEFWMKALQSAKDELTNASEHYLGIEEAVLRRVYQHYMFFNNNLGGTYRNYKFEKTLSGKFSQILSRRDCFLPHMVAHLASFIIAYDKGLGLPENIMEKIKIASPQFTVSDIMTLSRGIQISLLFNPNNIRRIYTEQIASLSHLLNDCTETLLKKQKSLFSVTTLTVAFLNRNGSSRSYFFDTLIWAHLQYMEELNSRTLRDISMIFHRTNYRCSEMLESMAEYIINNQEYILADTLERFLRCIFIVGYHPQNSGSFFKACLNIIEQDKSQLLGLSYLEMSLALCFYGYITPELIQNVFSIKFLDKLDEEITSCYAKGTYPPRVRHTLMELNRAVCIDHPEEKIPWFHEKYCEDLLQTVAVPNRAFHLEVHQALAQIVGGAEVLRANVTTPYYYLLDFEFMLDSNNRPVPISEYATDSKKTANSKSIGVENNPGYKRLAVLLREEKSFCVNIRHIMGRHQLERRHLEIMGYEVLEVPHFMWYSMAHASHEDRISYLKSLIYNQ
ncbi:hypothetical protein SK128_028102 [Halocaridina rubra]|uniref:RAP domain-containing protein n=1 Tax=Halocaridina rubra TaxID=373956 RepID=A0AAN8WWB5_HALRR